MQALLSFDKAPPFSVPVRFMVSAPLFGLAAGGLLLAVGADALSSRWAPLSLALTHLFTAGFLLQVMLGALFQIMPVAVGANIVRPLLIARLVHVASFAGAVALVGGFALGSALLLQVAAALLGLGIGTFLVAAARALWSASNANPTALAIKLALVGLAITLGLGLSLVAGWVGGHAAPMPLLTDLHAAWGLIGWGGALLAGVAYVVVPMFQLTPGYGAKFSRRYGPALAIAILVWSVLRWVGAEWPSTVLQLGLGLLVAGFAAMTLWLQKQSKRARADTTMRYWRVGMGSAILAALTLIAMAVFDPESAWTPASFLLATLAIGGALVSVVSGMLYKILPFLSWLHLQNFSASLAAPGEKPAKVPHMGEYLPERLMNRQFIAHLVALALLLAAAFGADVVARLAGAALVMSQGLLLANIVAVIRRYAAVRRSLSRSTPGA